MKITNIKAAVKSDNYLIFIDHKYRLSLSGDTLLRSGLTSNTEIDDQQLKKLESLASEDKLLNQTISYATYSLRTSYQVKNFLNQKTTNQDLIDKLLVKLSSIGLIDDRKYVQSYINDANNLRPSSKIKLKSVLVRKQIPSSLIEEVMKESEINDQDVLGNIIQRKITQSRYQDPLKLTQYLVRQGFGYGDVKNAIQQYKNKDEN